MVVGHINSDGSGLQTYDASEYSAYGLVVNGDGSRAFFISETSICKIEDTGISKVIDIDIFYPYELDTTDSGAHVYCTLNGRKGVLKFNSEGGDPEIAVQGNDVELSGNNTSSIHDFAVSSDGQSIAFLVNGYVSDETTYDKPEVFSCIDGVYDQLTSNGVVNDGSFKLIHDISGNGEMILYTDDDLYFIVSSTASEPRELGNYDGWGTLNGSGKMMFVSDSGKGVIVDTESNQELILFPREGIDINGDIGNTFISSNGKIISFTATDAEYQSSIYVGHFYSDAGDIVPDLLSVNQSTSVVYSDDVPEPKSHGSGSDDDDDGVSKSAEVPTSTGGDGLESSDDVEHVSSSEAEKMTDAGSDEKSAGYALATPFLISVLGLCAMLVSRKDRR